MPRPRRRGVSSGARDGDERSALLERLRRYLDQERITYEVREHPVAYTAQEIAALEHVAGRRMAKVVMALVGDDLVMLVLPAPHR